MKTIQLYGEIGFDALASDVADQLNAANGEDVSVRIFSYGGAAAEGLAIYNILSSYSGKVTTYIDGVAASAAGMPFMAGEVRIMPENALLHMHTAWGSASGNSDKFRSLADQYDAHTNSIAEIYAKKAKKDKAKIIAWMQAGQGIGTWFSAADAMAEGFATDIEAPVLALASAAPEPPEHLLRNAPLNLQQWASIAKDVNSRTASSTMAATEVAAKAASAPTPTTVSQASATTASVGAEAAQASAAPAPGPEAALVASLRRENEIRRCAAQAKLEPAAIEALVEGGRPFSEVAVEIVRVAAQRQEAAVLAGHPARLGVINDEGSKLIGGIEAAVWARVKPDEAPADSARQFRGMRMMEIARVYLQSRGVKTEDRSKNELVSLALHTSDDFVNIMSNTGNRSMMIGWEEERHEWEVFSTRRDLPDFRPTTDLFVDGDLTLAKVNQGTPSDAKKIDARMEGSEYQMGTLIDGLTSWRLDKFTRGLRVAEEVFINDDLSALSTVPEQFGRGARRVQANSIYGMITSGANASIDNLPLYDNSHNNTGTGVLGIAGLATGRLKMSTLKTPAGAPLELEPAFLLAPQALWATGKQVLYPNGFSPNTLTGANGPNPFAGTLTDIYNSRLDADSAAKWYLLAPKTRVEGIGYGFLQGESGPTLTTVSKRNPDCVEFLMRMYFGCAIKDWRFIYRSSGVG